MRESPRIIFAGTPEFAVPPLQKLADAGFKPLAVYTQPDRPAGRGKILGASPVKRLAKRLHIPVHQPTTLRDKHEQHRLQALEPDLIVVVAYGLILPAAVLAAPTFGCWNIHASLLPRWRGAAPIQRAIEAGDAQSGISLMLMDEGLDTGPVLMQSSVELTAAETAASLHDKLTVAGADSLIEAVYQLVKEGAGSPSLRPARQDNSKASYARKLSKDEAEIDWNEPAVSIERRIRAFNPWPVCWFRLGQTRIRVWKATLAGSDAIAGGPAEAGRVLGSGKLGIDIATAQGILRLEELQPAGGRRMNAASFLNARTLPSQLPAASRTASRS